MRISDWSSDVCSSDLLEQAVQSVATNNRITVDQLRQQLQTEGLNFDQFRRDLRNEILIQRLRQRIMQGRVAVSDTEIELALAAQGNNRELHLAHILVALPDAATPEQIATAKSKNEGAKDLIHKDRKSDGEGKRLSVRGK